MGGCVQENKAVVLDEVIRLAITIDTYLKRKPAKEKIRCAFRRFFPEGVIRSGCNLTAVLVGDYVLKAGGKRQIEVIREAEKVFGVAFAESFYIGERVIVQERGELVTEKTDELKALAEKAKGFGYDDITIANVGRFKGVLKIFDINER